MLFAYIFSVIWENKVPKLAVFSLKYGERNLWNNNSENYYIKIIKILLICNFPLDIIIMYILAIT